MKKIKVCSQCGSSDLTGHHTSLYNWLTQRWEPDINVHHVTCESCQMEVSTKEIRVNYTTHDLWFYFCITSQFDVARELRKMLDKPTHAKKVGFKAELTSPDLATLLIKGFTWSKTKQGNSFWLIALDKLQATGL